MPVFHIRVQFSVVGGEHWGGTWQLLYTIKLNNDQQILSNGAMHHNRIALSAESIIQPINKVVVRLAHATVRFYLREKCGIRCTYIALCVFQWCNFSKHVLLSSIEPILLHPMIIPRGSEWSYVKKSCNKTIIKLEVRTRPQTIVSNTIKMSMTDVCRHSHCSYRTL